MSSPSGSHFHPSIHGKSRISCSQRTDSSSNSKHQSKVQFVQKDTNQSHQFAKLPANPPSQRASASDFPSCQVHKSIQSDPFSPLYPPFFFFFSTLFFLRFLFSDPVEYYREHIWLANIIPGEDLSRLSQLWKLTQVVQGCCLRLTSSPSLLFLKMCGLFWDLGVCEWLDFGFVFEECVY